MKTREQCAKKLNYLLNVGPQNSKGQAWHFGKVELKEFLDWFYDGPPISDSEILKDLTREERKQLRERNKNI